MELNNYEYDGGRSITPYAESEGNEWEQEKFNRIREIAGKNWLKPASVSLAKLDEVKASVYNVNLTDPKALKSTRSRLKKVPDISAEPPLSAVSSQIHSWDKNTEIPILIKQQSEKQKQRPESAKILKTVRPPSGKKTRPQSAKEYTGNHEQQFGVKGARSELQDRPLGGIPLSSANGWISARGDLPPDDIDVPPAPRASPDLMEMLDSYQPEHRLTDVREGGTRLHTPDTKPVLLRRPTPEPIHFTLPVASQDPQASLDIDTPRLLKAVNDAELAINHKSGFGYHHVTPVSSRGQDDPEQTSEEQVVIDEEDDLADGYSDPVPIISIPEPESMDPNKYKRNTLNVTFAEDKNTLLDITPRERRLNKSRNVITRNRPKSSRSDLRYVRSRVDSGIKLTADKKNATTNGSNEELDQNTNEQVAHSYGRTGSKDSLFSNASTVSVEYLEDSDQDSNADDTKGRRKRLSRTKSDVETMISQISITDDEDENHQTEKVTTPKTNEAKSSKTSNPNRNFYQLAMQVKRDNMKEAKKNRTVIEQKFKTTKTLEFSEGEIKETKDVNLIGTVVTEIEPTEKPIPQRPVYPNKGRPPPLVHSKKKKHKHTKKTKNAVIEPTSKAEEVEEKTDLKPLESTRSLEDAPSQPHEVLRKRRVVSAPAGRISERAFIAKTAGERRLRARHAFVKSLSKEKSAFGGVNMKNKFKDIVRANTAAKLMRKGALSKPKEFDNQKFYSSYTKEAPKSAGSTRSRSSDKKEAPTEVVEIWTRQDDYDVPSQGLQECKDIQDKLIENGVPVSLQTLTRALLPPREFNYFGPLHTNAIPKLPSYSSGLLSDPSTWLTTEYKKIERAKTAMRSKEPLTLVTASAMKK